MNRAFRHLPLAAVLPVFAAVAQVLAYVYQLKAAMAGRGQAPTELPDPQVPAELDPHNKPGAMPDDADDLAD